MSTLHLGEHPAPGAAPEPITDRDLALARLADRYHAPVGGNILPDGHGGSVQRGQAAWPLLPWRYERRFVELRRLVADRTVEEASTLRFAAIAQVGQRSLRGLLLRELDLCAFITGAEVVSVFAVCAGEQAANVVVGLANGVKASVECSTLLPAGCPAVDRHEIIARRGVAADRVVDTQVPQASIYAFGPGGERRFTDTDAELYGLEAEDVALVRAAFAVLTVADGTRDWPARRSRLDRQVEAVFRSEAEHRRINL